MDPDSGTLHSDGEIEIIAANTIMKTQQQNVLGLAIRWQVGVCSLPSNGKLTDLGCTIEIIAAHTIMKYNTNGACSEITAGRKVWKQMLNWGAFEPAIR